MAQPTIQTKKTKIESKTSLKGTLTSVFLLGFFLIATWVIVYSVFLIRS